MTGEPAASQAVNEEKAFAGSLVLVAPTSIRNAGRPNSVRALLYQPQEPMARHRTGRL